MPGSGANPPREFAADAASARPAHGTPPRPVVAGSAHLERSLAPRRRWAPLEESAQSVSVIARHWMFWSASPADA